MQPVPSHQSAIPDPSAEEWLRFACDIADLGIWRLNTQSEDAGLQGDIHFDERARIHYGFDRHDAIAAEVMERIPEEDQDRLNQDMDVARDPARDGSYTTEHRILHPDGTTHWLAVRGRVYFTGVGLERRQVCIIGTSRDITQQKQSEKALQLSEQRFAKAFHASPTALAITRFADGMFVDVNDSFRELFGYQRDELIGRRSTDLDLYIKPAERAELLRNIREQGSLRDYEMICRPKMGGEITVLFSSEHIEIGGESHILATIIDITDRKRAEQALHEIALDLSRSNTELEQFAYVASHDLQEPLRAISTMVQMIQQHYEDQPDELADKYIAHAIEASFRMQALINDLLAVSRVGTRAKAFALTSLEDALDVACSDLTVALHESGAAITHDPLPTLMADRLQLIQVFQNLLGNAMKFRGLRPVAIHIGAEHHGDEWRISVSDTGIGIDPAYADRIFVIFQRLHTRREYPGTGIGLAICKKIVERHGGRIWVESQPGQGATFFFTLKDSERR